MEEQKNKIYLSLKKLMEDVDKGHLRDVQGKFYKCAAVCCENKESTTENVQRCVENCWAPFQNAQNFVKKEFEDFQNNLHRCITTCQYHAQGKMNTGVSESQIETEFEKCVTKCIDSHFELLPNILKRIKEFFKKESFFTNP